MNFEKNNIRMELQLNLGLQKNIFKKPDAVLL